MRIAYRPAVAADLVEIGAFIAKDNPERAIAFVARLIARCRKIGLNPGVGRFRPEIGDGIQSRAYRDYVILYCVEPDCVRVVRVVHGARDLKRLKV